MTTNTALGDQVTEFSVPANFKIRGDANLTDAIFGNASDFPDNVSFDR